MRPITLSLLILLVVVGCAESKNPLVIDSVGEIAVTAYLDRDGDGELQAGIDAPAVGVRVALLRVSGDTVRTGVTDALGLVRFTSLALGTYRLGVNPAQLGDTLRVTWPDTARIAVTAAEPKQVAFSLGYPLVTSAGLAAVPVGRMVTAKGAALHQFNIFGDSLLHVMDANAALRVVALPENAAASTGDSVRITGRVGTSNGRPAIVNARVFRLGTAREPVAHEISTAAAATARSGELDGALVRLQDARVLSVVNLAGGDVRVRVSDGTGAVDVVLDRHANIVTEDPVVAGVLLNVNGILVPRVATPGEWTVKPRASLDVGITVPRVTTLEARSLVAGSLVEIHGVALNGIATFGDNTVHIADPSGALRLTGVTAAFQFAGDSIRALGVLALRDGQMVLNQATVTVLGKAPIPPPTHVATEVAATANGGVLDAALVEVRDAVVETLSAPSGGDVTLRVDDGTGDLIVILDRDTGIGTAALTIGSKANFVGVLVPVASGSWQLKPRTPADVVKQ